MKKILFYNSFQHFSIALYLCCLCLYAPYKSEEVTLSVLPVLAETAQNSACISVAILMASLSVLCFSSKGLKKDSEVIKDECAYENM